MKYYHTLCENTVTSQVFGDVLDLKRQFESHSLQKSTLKVFCIKQYTGLPLVPCLNSSVSEEKKIVVDFTKFAIEITFEICFYKICKRNLRRR